VAIWLPAPLGLAALAGLRRTFARWAEEDALPAEPAPAAALLPVRRPEPVHLPVWPGRERAVQVPA
jgi:hypothetical protein